MLWNEILAQIISGLALLIGVASYFVDKKNYLLFQALTIIGLALSYLLLGEYFAMLALAVGLGRAFTFYWYEKEEKNAPLVLSFLFAGLTVAAYFIVNFGILKTAKYEDILYLIAMICFAFTFRIRNLKTLRYVTLIPAGLSVVYGFLSKATIFAVLAYALELVAVIFAILKYHVFGKEQEGK